MQVAAASENRQSASLAHLLDELARIDVLIRAQVARARNLSPSEEQFRGLTISEREVDELVSCRPGLPPWATEETTPSLADLRAQQQQYRKRIDFGKLASLRQGARLRLEDLSWHFGLEAFDLDTLLICLAPEIGLRYDRLYAYLQDDITKRRPRVDLVLNLLCGSLQEKVAMRQRFAAGSPLMRNRLVCLSDDPPQQPATLLGKCLRLDDRVASFLLDGDEFDERILPYAALRTPEVSLDELILPSDTKRRLVSLIETDGEAGEKLAIYFRGPTGSGKKTTAEALCRHLGQVVLAVDGERLLAPSNSDFEELSRLIAREASLQGAALCWNGIDKLLLDENWERLHAFAQVLDDHKGLILLTGEEPWLPVGDAGQSGVVSVEFPPLDTSQRLGLWIRYLPTDAEKSSLDLQSIASQFRFTGGQIRKAAATARTLARWRDPDAPRLTTEDLRAACRTHSNHKLGTLAQSIAPRHTWDDIVLPEDRLRHLKELLDAAKHRAVVYNDWGFHRKLSSGRGLAVLFSGPSGTGKTMAAGIIAGELGLALYKIDLSMVVSKYIGETEKNLARIFEEAETANAILFFDEADALFGKRSEVRDAHDRYANIEVAYLLQKIETYEGIVILASNFRKNIDDAFVRRLQFQIEFPFPDAEHRRRIWNGIWPDETPRCSNLDLASIADRFEIAGGNISNIALSAAFLAASDGGQVTPPLLHAAIQREYQKMGKVITDAHTVRRMVSPTEALADGNRLETH